METTAKKAAFKLEKLDTDLKNYKSNSIKESIRWAQSWAGHVGPVDSDGNGNIRSASDAVSTACFKIVCVQKSTVSKQEGGGGGGTKMQGNMTKSLSNHMI